MEFGAHLPLMDFGGNPYTLDHLISYTKAAERLGFAAVAVNDHMVFSVPWLDGPTALAVVLEHTGTMDLATTVALPVIRGPIPLAKTIGALDRLSAGRVVLAVGPGSSPKDYEAVGLEFDERWKRLDEAIQTMRTLWSTKSTEPFVGRYYSTDDVNLLPQPSRPGGPRIWVGSWGSEAGLKRTARLADGWLASAYNTTPDGFAAAWERLGELLDSRGRDVGDFPNGLATMWFHITDDAAEAESVYTERLIPTINRHEEVIRDRVPVGPPAQLAEKLIAFKQAGVQRVYLWPVCDEITQIERFSETVAPLVDTS
jgi:alkanesulfonate monooxygenase SsuD/methylene tetrahydromethanopterin reductase-like flavin-dependent oxidoreductase (luciferase family)